MVVVRWGLGLLIALGVGHFVTTMLLDWLRERVERVHPEEAVNWRGPSIVPPEVTGLIERLFFTIIVAFDISGAAPGMMTWLAVKMLTHWNRVENNLPPFSAGAFTALLAGLVSMFFALVGGLICKGGGGR